MQFFVLIVTTLWLTVLTSPLLAWQPLPQAAPPQQSERRFVLGLSAQGRPIEVVQFGNGPRKLVVVGNAHGGPEANTYRLTNELIGHLAANPELVPPSVRLFLIPSLNPDGLALGWRFDAAGVDLNRNMNTNLDACPDNDWSQTVFGAYGLIAETGGPYPDSQVEVRLLRAFLLDAAGAIFLHSNAGLVFPATCEHAPSIAMAERYASAAGYLYSRYWPLYAITGGMHDWAGSMGLAAITPELITGTDSEFPQNLAGLLAVLEDPAKLLPLPEDGEVAGETIPAPIYRYWRALGGEAQFGVPQGPAQQTGDQIRQRFATVELVIDNEQRDTIWFVQPAPLGSRAATSRAYGGSAALVPLTEPGDALIFPETGHRLRDAFRAFWQREGGLMAFGLPLSEEFRTLTADGQARTIQYFERAIFAYAAEDGSVRLEPLGLREAALEHLALPARHMAR